MTSDLPFDLNQPFESNELTNNKNFKGLFLVGLTGMHISIYIFFIRKNIIFIFQLGGASIALSIICYPFVSPALRKVCLPYVPATNVQIQNVLHVIKGRKGKLVDLGSGDGRIVRYLFYFINKLLNIYF